jgi:hypothetical protein
VEVLVKATSDSEEGNMPSAELLEAMGKYNEEMVDAGIMLAGEGLHPSSKGKRVTFDGSAGLSWTARLRRHASWSRASGSGKSRTWRKR